MDSNDENQEKHAAQRDESSSPDQIPDPVLNIVMYEKTNKKYY